MGVQVFKRNAVATLLLTLIPLAITIIIVVFVMIGLRQTEESNRAEGIRLLEEALRRTVIHSYAVDGFFPESLEYIENHFGVYIDHTRFVVHYEVFASNIQPTIRVFELNPSIN